VKKIITTLFTVLLLGLNISPVLAVNLAEETETSPNPNYLRAVIGSDEAIEVNKSTIFDASQSFVPNSSENLEYNWDFGDGNSNVGDEVLHTYKNPGRYTVSLRISDENNFSEIKKEIFVYNKLVLFITDQENAEDRIKDLINFAETKGVFINLLESYGSSTEFISEEVLTKKMNESTSAIQKASQVTIWTKENGGLNAISRFIQGNPNKTYTDFSQKQIIIIDNDLEQSFSRIQRQYSSISPKNIILIQEGAIQQVIQTEDEDNIITTLEDNGYGYKVINRSDLQAKPWNFLSFFLNTLIDNGIPDNTIALLLLLPVIATVVAFMKQVVGVTTFGIYTPSIITLSFLVIGIYAGLITLAVVITVGIIARKLLKKIRMLYIPKMAIVITLVAFVLFLILIMGINLKIIDAQFLSIAIFPMLILSTLVEKIMSVKSEKGLSSATIIMLSTVLVSIIAYFLVGGEINLGFTVLKSEFIKNQVMSYPELIFLFLAINLFLGRWSGLRILERIRFREIFRHIEE